MHAAAPSPASSGELQKHITATYLNLRVGMGVLSLLFPILLALGGWIALGLSLQPSMSAYYHTGMRNVFVGVLWAVGAFLYLYKGFSPQENYVLTAAGVFAIAIALLPPGPPNAPPSLTSTLHGVVAVLFFLCIAYTCIFRASDTLPLIGDGKRAERYDRLYRWLGVGMVASPATAWLLNVLAERGSDRSYYVLFVEVAGVWTFSAYWLAKSREIQQTEADQRVVAAEVERDDRGNVIPLGAASPPPPLNSPTSPPTPTPAAPRP